jgi:hypothetical protein
MHPSSSVNPLAVTVSNCLALAAAEALSAHGCGRLMWPSDVDSTSDTGHTGIAHIFQRLVLARNLSN